MEDSKHPTQWRYQTYSSVKKDSCMAIIKFLNMLSVIDPEAPSLLKICQNAITPKT
jgi:alkyl hydroperoxide reductase subunit AhpF